MVLRGGLPLTVCGGGGSITKKKSTPSIGMVLPFHWASTNCLCTVCGGGGIITEKINQLFFFFFTVTETKAEAAFKAEKMLELNVVVKEISFLKKKIRYNSLLSVETFGTHILKTQN